MAKRRLGAGASAQRKADAIRAAERRRQHRTARWLLPVVVAPLAGVTGYVTGHATDRDAGLAVTLVIAVLAMRLIYRSSGSTWARGAAGERLTRRILIPLVWRGLGRWVVLHDRQVPGSRANLDHIVLGPAGALLIDTKTWSSTRSQVRLDRNGELWYGRHSQAAAMRTVKWEAEQATRALGCPVRPLVAVHHAPVPPGGLHTEGLVVLPAKELPRFLRDLPRQPGWDRARVQALRTKADALLPPYRA